MANRIVYDRGIRKSYEPHKGYNFNPATNQWNRFSDYEPGGLSRTPADNPEFLWPANQYMDIAGNTHTVQRGYMRSLVTDPAFNLTDKKAPNRRLFFQFNPQVLVRSVQQTVGAMNPLLQDPAQLTMPVPGTATFGFELLFNREHEVASGKVESKYDLPTLPDNTQAIPSKVGVLADLLILDAITGQGISKDLVEILTAQTQAQTMSNIVTAETDLTDSDEDDKLRKEFDRTKAALNTLQDQYNINIGNQAFLNPLPFRVLFSSLFMVEGVATSVDVQFQKFNKNMVPTQCKVTINMYALYIGFAQKNTFLTSNLENSMTSTREEQLSRESTASILKSGIQSAKAYLYNNGSDNQYGVYAPSRLAVYNISSSDSFKNALSQKTIEDVKLRVSLEYSWTQSPSDSVLKASREVVSEIPWNKVNSGELGTKAYLDGNKFSLTGKLDELFYNANPSLYTYLSYRVVLNLISKNDVISDDIYLSGVYGNTSWSSEAAYGDLPEVVYIKDTNPIGVSGGARQ